MAGRLYETWRYERIAVGAAKGEEPEFDGRKGLGCQNLWFDAAERWSVGNLSGRTVF